MRVWWQCIACGSHGIGRVEGPQTFVPNVCVFCAWDELNVHFRLENGQVVVVAYHAEGETETEGWEEPEGTDTPCREP